MAATRNPHLFINTYAAVRAGTVSHHYVPQTVGMATQQIREDRILHEALATGGDVRQLCDRQQIPARVRSLVTAAGSAQG